MKLRADAWMECKTRNERTVTRANENIDRALKRLEAIIGLGMDFEPCRDDDVTINIEDAEARSDIDLDMAREFLEALDPEADEFIFQTFADRKDLWRVVDATSPEKARAIQNGANIKPTKKRKDPLAGIHHGSLDDLADDLSDLNGQGAGIFVTVNAMRGKKRAAGEVERYRAVWADMDGKSGADTQPDWPIAPSLVVESSPGKFHFYWLIDGDMRPTDWQRVMTSIVAGFGADKNATDAARVLRLPGFVHSKAAARSVTSELRRADPSQRYTATKLIEAFARFAPAAPRVQSRVIDGIGRNAWAALGGAFGSHDRSPMLKAMVDALKFLPVDIGEGKTHEHWVRIGAALHHATGGSDEGLRAWIDWSRDSKDFDEGEIESKWPTFQREQRVGTDGRPNNAGAETIFRRAEEQGWQRPQWRGTAERMPGVSRPGTAVARTLPTLAFNHSENASVEFGLVVRHLDKRNMRNIEWLWHEHLAVGSINVIFGHSNVGKSTVIASIVAAVTSGNAFPLEPESDTRAPGEVLLLGGEEDTNGTVLPRLIASGADTDHVRLLDTVKAEERGVSSAERALSLTADMERLGQYLEAHPATKLIVMDPLNNFIGGTDGNNNAELRAVLTPLKMLAERHRLAVLIFGHTRKNSDGLAIDRLAGSGALQQVARSVLLVGVFPEDAGKERPRRVLLTVKSNEIANPHATLFKIEGAKVEGGADPVVNTRKAEWIGKTSDIRPEDVLDAVANAKKSSTVDEAVQWLFRTMQPDKAYDAEEMRSAAAANGFSDATIRRARVRLGIDVRKKSGGMSGGWTWTLTAAAVAAHNREGPGTQAATDSEL